MQGYRFGDFELDLDAVQLRRDGRPVKLERRPLDLLVLLVRQHGHLVAREDIIAALWPKNVIIDFDSGLNTLIRKVRNALGDDTDQPRFIETVPGRGYRFIAEVTEPEPPPIVSGQQAVERTTAPRHWVYLTALLALLATAAGVWFWQEGPVAPATTRIAVLPFENLTGSEDFDYLASGLAEETSTAFGQIDLPGFRLIGGVSARALARSGSSVIEAGRELGIDFIVQNSLRADQSRVRVTSRLIRVADGEQTWSASFDRELTNVLGLQRELSIAIAEQVRQRLSPDIAATIDRRQTSNPVAYELYLKGRYEWSRLVPYSIRRALEYYEQAVAEDPGYALAWAGIAHALATMPVTANANPETVRAKARDALEHALQSGPELAETQFALCAVNFFLDWDLPLAEAAGRKAVELDPNNGTIHMLLGIVLAHQHNYVEAVAMMRRARELDPLFPLIFANSAYVARVAGDPQASIEFATQAIAMAPAFWVGYLQLADTQLALGNEELALSAFSQADNYSGGNAKAVAGRANVLARLGREEEARDLLASLEAMSLDSYVSPGLFAAVHAGLGEDDLAFAWLDQALAARDLIIRNLATNPLLDPLHKDPRFESFIRRAETASGPDDSR